MKSEMVQWIDNKHLKKNWCCSFECFIDLLDVKYNCNLPIQDVVSIVPLISDHLTKWLKSRFPQLGQCIHSGQMNMDYLEVLKWNKKYWDLFTHASTPSPPPPHTPTQLVFLLKILAIMDNFDAKILPLKFFRFMVWVYWNKSSYVTSFLSIVVYMCIFFVSMLCIFASK